MSCVVGRYLVTIDNVTSCTALCPDRHYAGIDVSSRSASFDLTECHVLR